MGDFSDDFSSDFSGRGAVVPNAPGSFPPSSPVTLTRTIPSYLYTQYADDDSLQAFVASYNQTAQSYVTWFASGQLANYTVQVGLLLDIVGAGIYGVVRPSLSSQFSIDVGPFNSFVYNTIPFDSFRVQAPQNTVAVSDDVYKRIITWNFFKGDGNVFCVSWLKRRVVRFLFGADGQDTPLTANTQQVSVTIAGATWTITLITGIRKIIQGPFNTWLLNSIPFNGDTSTFTPLTPIPNGILLQEAVRAGILVLPFQYSFVVNVG